ncbi:methyl-accepting chemotaxis protein [Marinicauda algicola]|uniref:Methyl-accepting chemotaxis protein n=1 Tax=Marinicauda algicola TaxID=2029849 RepID=A0A4S2GY75_9PROT|nr:methyl-accepting chemotaxis protein [Marinicauda algicola]TGY88180.1 methyl-accepting chemotaxis protein [Marinicauda algicola]
MLSIVRRSISAKVASAAAVLVICALSMGVTAFLLLGESNRRLGDMYQQEVVGLETADDIKAALYRIRSDSLEYVLADRDETRMRFREEIDNQNIRVRERLDQLRSADLDESEQAFVSDIEAQADQYVTMLETRLFAAIERGDRAYAEDLARNEAAEIFRAARDAANAFMDYSVERAARRMSNAETDQARAGFLITALIVVAALIGISAVWFLQQNVSRPLTRIAAGLKRLAEKDWKVEIPGAGRADEIGRIADAAEEFRRTGMEAERLEAEAAEAGARAEAEKQKALKLLADRFEEAVGGVVTQVAAAAEQLTTFAGQMSKMAREGNEQAMSVSAAAEQASTNVQSVAGAAEEFSATLREVVKQIRASADQTREALTLSHSSKLSMESLSSAIENVAGVTSLIAEIAEKTNLLALNATIESARAGEAGKGFAVVASEVKQLAAQTARATSEISGRIEEIKTTSSRTSQSVAAIARFIEQIQLNSESISAATEEQQATIDDISRNVAEAANGTSEVSAGAHGFREFSGRSQSTSAELSDAAQLLSGQAQTLKNEIGRFLGQIRTA